jgi:hypothetical protein
MAPCRYFVDRHFGGTYHLHLHGVRNGLAMNQREQVTVDVLDFLYPEDGGYTFLRNIGQQNICTAPYPRRRHSSHSLLYISLECSVCFWNEVSSSFCDIDHCLLYQLTFSVHTPLGDYTGLSFHNLTASVV